MAVLEQLLTLWLLLADMDVPGDTGDAVRERAASPGLEIRLQNREDTEGETRFPCVVDL